MQRKRETHTERSGFNQQFAMTEGVSIVCRDGTCHGGIMACNLHECLGDT